MSKQKAYDMIKKKAKKLKELRTNSSRNMTPSQIMLRYMEEVDEVRRSSADAVAFEDGLEKTTRILAGRLRAFDVDVHVQVQWTEAEKWKDLNVTGIRITWSDQYILDNPDKSKEETIDIAHLFVDGLFD